MVKKVFEKEGALGLFHLFLTKSFFNSIVEWTHQKYVSLAKPTISKEDFQTYLGLELAMSLSHQNSIAGYWSNKAFIGVKGFQEVMCRNKFQRIRSSLQFRPMGVDSLDIKHQDPLWRSRTILSELLTNCMDTAIAPGVMSLDEATISTKAKCRAKTYIPSKPDKYRIRLYAFNCWNSLYLQNTFDNGTGNSCGLSFADRYVSVFPELRTLLKKMLKQSVRTKLFKEWIVRSNRGYGVFR